MEKKAEDVASKEEEKVVAMAVALAKVAKVQPERKSQERSLQLLSG